MCQPPSLLRFPVPTQRVYPLTRMLLYLLVFSLHRTGSMSDLQFPVPASKHSVTSTSPTVPVEEPTPETGNSSDHSSSAADEGEVSDLDSTDQEELLEGDQELSAEQSYRETLCHGLE